MFRCFYGYFPSPFINCVHFPLEKSIVSTWRLTCHQLLVAYVFLFATSTLTIKLSVLFFYLRVFVNRSMIRATKVVMVWVVLWSLGNILQIFLICRPFAASYDPSVSGTCGDQKASFIAIGSFNAVTDVVILCLPIPTIWALKATRRTKIFLTIMFTAGLL